MTKFKLRFVDVEKDRGERVHYYYFRRGGRRWRLPGEPLSEEFMAEYYRLLVATEPVRKSEGPRVHPPRSFGALIDEYFADREAFGEKKPSTQRIYRAILEPLVEVHGYKPVALLERRHIKAWRDARGETPGMANMIVKVVRLVMSYAVDNDYQKNNPALRIKLFKLGEHRAWTDEECAAFEARWPAGSMQRRAYMLAKFSGQRCGDLANMTRAHRKHGAIRVVQIKTGAELWIPEHRDLAAELALGNGHMSLLTRADGSAFDADALGHWFADAIEDAGLPDACVMHGLRKTAARMLAEVGCSAHQIASVTGHRSLKEVERYTNAADQKRLATAAIHRLEQNGNRTATAKRLSPTTAKRKPKG
jgi:integrase